MRLQRRIAVAGIFTLILWQFWYLGRSLRAPDEPVDIPTATLPPRPVPPRVDAVPVSIRNESENIRWVEKLLNFYRSHGDEKYCESARKFAFDMLFASDPSFTPELGRLLKRQFLMHDAVANGTPYKNQTYLIWSLSGGLGNRFQSLVSTFMLALLSGRVLLLKDWFTPLPKNSKSNRPMIFPSPYTDEYQMEALEKLFWFSNPLVPEKSARPLNSRLLCPIFPMMTVSEFQEKYPSHFGKATKILPFKLGHVKIDLSARHDKKLVRWSRVACGNVSDHSMDSNTPTHIHRKRFFSETFVYVWTNQYFLPLLFANPFHGEYMQKILPIRPYSTLIKLLVLPSSVVMGRVARFFDDQRQRFPQRPLVPGAYAALQVRAFSFAEMPDLSSAFLRCFQQDRIDDREPFFLATMHDQIRSAFSNTYNLSVLRAQSSKSAGDQHTGKGSEPDVEALVDMLLLALGKKIFLSPGSTFGTFAAAFGEVPAVRVDWKVLRGNQGNLCNALPSLQPCFGSWYRYDHLFQRSNLGSNKTVGNDVPCQLLPLKAGVMFC